jgi:replicative DNA helicase
MDDETAQLPPHDLECERWALGTAMVNGNDPVRLSSITAELGEDPTVFFSADHQAIYSAILRIHSRGQQFGAVEVAAELRASGVLEAVGGFPILAGLLDVGRLAYGHESSAGVVVERHRRRRAWQIARVLEKRAFSNATDEAIDSHLETAIAELIGLRRESAAVEVITIGDAAAHALELSRTADGIGIPTTYAQLDNYATVFAGGYTVLAARPSIGKSMLTKCILARMAGVGITTGLVSVEENRVKIGQNALANAGDIENGKFSHGRLSQFDDERAEKALGILKPLPFYVVDRVMEIGEVLQAFDVLAIKHRCQVIAVDHLHLIRDRRTYGNREHELSTISAALKEAAQKHGVGTIIVAQLNRSLEGRDDKVPQMSDLRGSGAIEEHADAVLLLHREDYYHKSDKNYEPTNRAELHVAKNRNGPLGMVDLYADLVHQRFIELEQVEVF